MVIGRCVFVIHIRKMLEFPPLLRHRLARYLQEINIFICRIKKSDDLLSWYLRNCP